METATLLEVLGSLQPVRMLVEPRLDLNIHQLPLGGIRKVLNGASSMLVLNLSPHCRTGISNFLSNGHLNLDGCRNVRIPLR